MKKITNILLATLVLTSFAMTSAKADDNYERICAPQGWTSCGEFIIYNADGLQVNRVVGPIPCNNCSPAGGSAVLITSVAPQPVIKTETIDEKVTLTVTLDVAAKVVAPNSDGSIGYKPNSELIPVIDSTTAATLSATEGSVKEVVMFETPKTRTQLEKAIENKLLLIQKYMNRFYTLLDGWLIA